MSPKSFIVLQLLVWSHVRLRGSLPAGETQPHNLLSVSHSCNLPCSMQRVEFRHQKWSREAFFISRSACVSTEPALLRRFWNALCPHGLPLPFPGKCGKVPYSPSGLPWCQTTHLVIGSIVINQLSHDFGRVVAPYCRPSSLKPLPTDQPGALREDELFWLLIWGGNLAGRVYLASPFNLPVINWALLDLCLFYTIGIMEIKWILQNRGNKVLLWLMKEWFVLNVNCLEARIL